MKNKNNAKHQNKDQALYRQSASKQSMNTHLQVFEHDTFGKVRTITIDGKPWWVLTDVCKVLGISNSRMVADRLEDDEKVVFKSQPGLHLNIPNRGLTIISESGLYAVILRSDKPNALPFRKWVTGTVLPSIRKYGAYITNDTLGRMMGDSEFTEVLMDALLEENARYQKLFAESVALNEKNVLLKNRNASLVADVAELEETLESISPKAHYCDRVLHSGDALQVSVIAKEYGLTAIAFNRLLHDLGIQYKVGSKGTWLLYKEYANKGYTKSNTFFTPSGDCVVQTRWTQSGRRFLYDMLAELGVYPLEERQPVFEL